MIPRDVAHILLRLCEETDTPRSLAVKICVENGALDQLLAMRVDPLRYRNSNSYFKDVLVTDLLRKCRGMVPPSALQQKAVSTFFESEYACYRANERLTPYIFGACPEGMERALEVFSLARKYVSFILGACPSLPDGRFGPGATFADRGLLTTVPDKMSSVPTLTAGALGVVPSWGATSWGRATSSRGGLLEEVRGNRFTTVPKDSTKDRGIAVEPSLNIYYQLAYGKAIRQRLRRVGVFLEKSQDLHRALAKSASLSGNLATIDLSNASDTLCSALVKLILPPSWFEALNALRSPFTLIEGKWVRLEKFSSMGNGFTFELETLIFQSLVFSILALEGFLPSEGENFSVFGDDILIPAEAYSSVRALLMYCGFTLNDRKSFHVGSFRESCGGDFYDGRPVRAFYLEEFPHEPHEWIAFANGIRRVVLSHHEVRGEGALAVRAWDVILHNIPSRIRSCFGPSGLGDLVINNSPDSWRPQSRTTRNSRQRPVGSYDPRVGDGIRYFRTWSPVRFRRIGWNHFQPNVVLATALYGTGDGLFGVTPRDSVLGYAERWVSYS